MKRLMTTAGLAALGAASIAPALAQDAMINQKPWSIGASLRGFYDDNYFTYPKALRERAGFDDDTFGFDISPTAAINLKRDQTTFGLSYLYTFRYYIDRESPHDDQSHQINLKLSHAFNERFSVDLKDSFVVAQEPTVIDPAFVTYPARAEGDNVRNTGTIQLNATVVDNFSVNGGYSNTYYDYEQQNKDVPELGFMGSRSAVLDRIEHLFYVDGNYQLLPKTTLSLGYQFGVNDYTSDGLFAPGLTGNDRDNRFHRVTVGVKQHLNPQLDVSAKVGVELTQYENQNVFDDQTNPYAEASVRWAYMQGSSINAGLRHQRIATDIRLIGTKAVADQQATLFWLSVNQAITSKITAILMGQYQHSSYGDSTPGAGELVDELFFVGATVAYQFNPHVAAEAGYTFDRLDSDASFIGNASRSYTRNRIYIGTRLSY